MTSAQWLTLSDAEFQLQGALDRESVVALWSSLQSWVPNADLVKCDLQAIERVDSAGMAFLIHLIEHAKKRNCHIMFGFVPAQLATLFQLSNVESLVAEHIQNYQG